MPNSERIILRNPSSYRGLPGRPGDDGTDGVGIVVKGTKATTGALPGSGNTVDDAWVVTADGGLYVWSGAAWNGPLTFNGGIPSSSGHSNGEVVTLVSGAPAWAAPTGGGGVDTSTIHAATSKTPPVDADEMLLVDSAASFGLKKLTWANLKAAVKTYLDGTGIAKLTTARNIDGQAFDGTAAITVIAPGTHAATAKTVPVANDEIPLVDSAASNVLKKVKVSDLLGNVPTAVDATDAVNKQQLDDATSVLLGSDPLEVAAALPGNIVNVFWDAGASSWHAANYTAQAADPNTGFHFTGGSAAVAPFSVARPLQPWTRAAT